MCFKSGSCSHATDSVCVPEKRKSKNSPHIAVARPSRCWFSAGQRGHQRHTRSDPGSAVHNKNQQTGISYVHRRRYPARGGTNACWEFCSTRDTSRLRITGAGTETSRNPSKYHIESWSSTPWCSRLVSETSPTFPRFNLKNTPHSPKAST